MSRAEQTSDRRETDHRNSNNFRSLQTLVFDRTYYDVDRARAWATEHNFDASKVYVRKNTINLRQRTPAKFKRDNGAYWSKTIKDGAIRLVFWHPNGSRKKKRTSTESSRSAKPTRQHKPTKRGSRAQENRPDAGGAGPRAQSAHSLDKYRYRRSEPQLTNGNRQT